MSDSGAIGRAVTILCFGFSAVYLLLRVPTPEFLLASNDQGYQMALGTAVAAGRLPGFDFVTQYGPFVAFSSYVGLVSTGSAVGEMVTCALGYAASIAIAVSLIQREAGRTAAVVGMVVLLALFPRYYKWYYWFFPLLGLMAARWYWWASRCSREAAARSDTRSVPIMWGLIAWGQIVGTSALFRYDLGLQGAVAGALAIVGAGFVPNKADFPRQIAARAVRFLTACALIPVAYTVLIGASRGAFQAWIFVRSIWSGVMDTVEYYRIPPYRIDLAHVDLQAVGLVLFQVILPVTYVIGLVLALRQAARDPTGMSLRAHTLFCAALTGLGIFPQALHRADFHHLLQVFPPFVIVLALIGDDFVRGRPTGTRLRRLSAVAVFDAALGALAISEPGAAFDLGPLLRDPVQTWRVVAGLPGSLATNPVADMAIALQRLTPEGSRVFFVMSPTDMPLLFFAHRHQPGLFPTYEPGMFMGPFWLARNRAILDRTPPDFLVVPVKPGPTDDNPAPFLPVLERSWMRHYSVELYASPKYRLLGLPR